MSVPRILIATPFDQAESHGGTCSLGYMFARERMLTQGARTLPATIGYSEDIVRARSRMADHALRRTDWDWMLWWDDDVIPEDGLVYRMVQAAELGGHHVVAAPYPRKRLPIEFPYVPMEGATRVDFHNGCAEVQAIAFGFCLTSRSCLETMTSYYRSTLWAVDGHRMEDARVVVQLFKNEFSPERDGFRAMMSEDYSFMYRWRALGGRVQMFAEPGMRLGHAGRHIFNGSWDELGNV